VAAWLEAFLPAWIEGRLAQPVKTAHAAPPRPLARIEAGRTTVAEPAGA
jgi:hypothetical protein